ncbi:MAG: histidine kinase [Candidatus Neomarinimicrobiota bacterium]
MSVLYNKNRLFWILQLSGWGIYWLYIITNAKSMGYYGVRYMIWNTLVVSIGFLLTVIIRYIYSRINFQALSLAKVFAIATGATLIIINVWYVLRLLVNKIMIQPGEQVVPTTIDYYLQGVFFWGVLIFAWHTLYFTIKFWMEWNEARERTRQADILAHKAQLQMLQYQLNPHFLFNSLNSIRALIEEDANNARSMISELSEFLRYSLLSKQYSDVPLRNEMEALQHYFAIEKKRFEDKLNIIFDIDPLANDFLVIRFLLHPLVENAIKYGMRTSPLPLTIQIIARVLNDTLILEVRNSGRWVDPAENLAQPSGSTGTGLSNIRQRLENAFPNRYTFDVIQKQNSVHFKLEISR